MPERKMKNGKCKREMREEVRLRIFEIVFQLSI
jgi:hypothetical protein